MGKDYYKILEVSKTANQDEIKKSYRKLALKWHPDRCPQDKKSEAQAKFQEIGEAFDVLSDPEKKKVYDQVGSEGLNGGIPEGFSTSNGGEGGNVPGGFHFTRGGGNSGTQTFHFSSSNADDIFRNFFGTSDPFQAGGGGDGFGMDDFTGFNMGGMPGGIHMRSMGGGGGGSGRRTRTSNASSPTATTAKPAAIHHDLNLSLEDLYTGTTKRIRITAKKIVDNTGRTQSISSDKEINVKPGWKDGTKITYAGEGDQNPYSEPADIVFVVKTKPHDRFKRDGDHLLYTCEISLQEAICGFSATVKTLDQRILRIQAPYVTPDTIKIIPAEGMPNSKTNSKGDLKITFKIIFPEIHQITASDKEQIGTILNKYKIPRK